MISTPSFLTRHVLRCFRGIPVTDTVRAWLRQQPGNLAREYLLRRERSLEIMLKDCSSASLHEQKEEGVEFTTHVFFLEPAWHVAKKWPASLPQQPTRPTVSNPERAVGLPYSNAGVRCPEVDADGGLLGHCELLLRHCCLQNTQCRVSETLAAEHSTLLRAHPGCLHKRRTCTVPLRMCKLMFLVLEALRSVLERCTTPHLND